MTDDNTANELHALGTAIFKNFKFLNDGKFGHYLSGDRYSRPKITREEQRFRLWAHSLGLHKIGHSSLDYRLRDAVVVRNYAADVLGELKNHLDDLLSIVLEVRKPYELESADDQEEPQNDENVKSSSRDESSLESQPSEDDPRSEASDATSEDSFHEVDFRITSITERIDALFRLAVKIRSPANRPLRTTAELYKRIPAASRQAYMQEREQVEISIVAYVQRQQLARMLKSDTTTVQVWTQTGKDGEAVQYSNVLTGETSQEKPLELMGAREQALSILDWVEHTSNSSQPGKKYYFNKKTLESVWKMPKEYRAASNTVIGDYETVAKTYANPDYWIVKRTGVANARRKQQFVYWKEHANSIGREVPEKPAAVSQDFTPQEMKPMAKSTMSGGALAQLVSTKSLATSATKLQSNVIKLDDLKSVISHQSRVSTVLSPHGEKIIWPEPPAELGKDRFFTCPYCSTLCPQSYLSSDSWRAHIIHDLQPYQCTYAECVDPYRLYSSREEWTRHENQHRRVWRCALDEAEFETQPLYVEHLRISHADSNNEILSPELVAAVVHPSLQTHRDCPFCPIAFTEVNEMQKHITWHLERFALFALPDIDDRETENNDRSERSSDSKQVIRPLKGRQDSIVTDFSLTQPLGLSEDYAMGERSLNEPVPTDPLFEQIRVEPGYQPEGRAEVNVSAWLETEIEGGSEEAGLVVPSWFRGPPPETFYPTSTTDSEVLYQDHDKNSRKAPPAPSTQLTFENLPFSREPTRTDLLAGEG